MTDPMVITSQGHFSTGIREVTTDFGVSVTGTHVGYQSPPSVRANLVLVHGGGGQALDMLTTPDGLPVAVVSAECSGFGPPCAATAAYLRECGADMTELRLAELGIHGNGHAMMLEKNSAEIAAVITDWIVKHV